MPLTDKTLPIDFFRVDPENARLHPEKQIELIAKSIKRFGFVSRLIARPDGQLIGGEATWMAARKAGLTEVPATLVDGLTEPQYRMLALALNKLPENSTWDAERLSEQMRELLGAGEDLRMIGFTEKELQELSYDPEELEIFEVSTTEVEDQFWISIRGPLKHQAEAIKALQAACGSMPDVSVELGTINLG
jgi:ParB-like chromosome segregation protein Spo0J